jgi:hypothetical protein
MDFEEAIRAHSNWKLKLSTYIRKPDGSLNASEIASDKKCTLGTWLYGDGRRFAGMKEYQQLVTEHAKFHKEASSLVKRADSGAAVSQDTALGSGSPYATTSKQVVTLIATMKSTVAKAA